jgi:hypothetical protein
LWRVGKFEMESLPLGAMCNGANSTAERIVSHAQVPKASGQPFVVTICVNLRNQRVKYWLLHLPYHLWDGSE